MGLKELYSTEVADPSIGAFA